MDVSIYVEGWREGVKTGMRREPLWKKLCIVGGGLIVAVLSIVIGSYEMSHWKQVVVIQNSFNNTGVFNNTYWENSTYYDIQYYNGTFSDPLKAANLSLSLNSTCDMTC